MIHKLGLIDYGMGNLHSVENAFKRIGTQIYIVKRPLDLNNCTALILPGVGAFDPAMQHLERTKLIPYIQDWIINEKPLLGICLGLQLLFESSEEGKSKGLGVIKGHVKKLPKTPNELIPHMGWSLLQGKRSCPLIDKKTNNNWMYFVHSFYAVPDNEKDLAATTIYGEQEVSSIIWKGRLGACQFHPEKSSQAGQRMLLRWLNWLKEGAENQF